MRGFAPTTVAGNVGDPILYAVTGSGEPCCTFNVAVEERLANNPTWVKINVYGGTVQICKERLKKGNYVIVHGRLMNRNLKPAVGVISTERALEVRAEEVLFMPTKPAND